MTDTERAKKVQQERSGSQDAGDLVNRAICSHSAVIIGKIRERKMIIELIDHWIRVCIIPLFWADQSTLLGSHIPYDG